MGVPKGMSERPVPPSGEGPLRPFPWGKAFIAGGLLLAALGYFAFATLRGSAVYYLTVSELPAKVSQGSPRSVRVAGKLVPGSFQRPAGSTVARFSITDGQGVLPAVYEGVLPDLFFNATSGVILEGRYGADRVFHAETVLVRHPDRFTAPSNRGR